MNQNTIDFTNDVTRPLADVLAGFMDKPRAVIDTFLAKGLAADLGIPVSLVTQSNALVQADYETITAVTVPTGDSRTPFTNVEYLAFLRIVKFLDEALNADPYAKKLIRKIAVNPRGI